MHSNPGSQEQYGPRGLSARGGRDSRCGDGRASWPLGLNRDVEPMRAPTRPKRTEPAHV